jgi:hypothetical protein
VRDATFQGIEEGFTTKETLDMIVVTTSKARHLKNENWIIMVQLCRP